MADNIVPVKVICEGGLDTTDNHLLLSANKPGSASRLINYEVGLNGGYRRINGFTDFAGEVNAATAEGKILGVIFYTNATTGEIKIMTARKNKSANTYGFYQYDNTLGWIAMPTGLTHNYVSGVHVVEKLRWDIGNDGVNNILCIVDGVNNALLYDGTSWIYANSSKSGNSFANAGGDQILDAPKFVSFFEKTLFLSTDERNNYRGIVCHSAPNDYSNFTAASGGGQIIGGFIIAQIKPFRDNLFIFGVNQISKIYLDNTDFVIKDVTKNLGVMNSDAVVEIGGDLIFLGPDGFRPIAGTEKIGDIQLETISKPIQRLLKNRIVSVGGIDVNSVVIRNKSQFRMFFGDDSFNVEDSKGILGALRTPDQQSGWEFSEIIGIRTSCVASYYINGVEYILHGDYDGHVYRQEDGNTFNGKEVSYAYSTPYLDLGDTEQIKVIDRLNLFLNAEDDTNITLGVSYNWGDEFTLNPLAYPITIPATVSLYGEAEYGVSTYGGTTFPVAITTLEGNFYSVRFTFSGATLDAPHTIQGLVIEFNPEGNR